MKKGAFTIVAKNYVGLAMILRESVLQHSPDVDFRIYVADEFESDAPTEPFVHISREALGYSDNEWNDMAFKYNLTEFCTAIKPACFQHMFSLGMEKVLFFDPDIYVFSSLEPLFEELDNHDILLTPHVCLIHPEYRGQQPEWTFNTNGIYNLGFCALKDSQQTRCFLDWWRVRMQDDAFTDRSVGNFTDQKWMDWAPALFGDRFGTVSHLGVNVAPWNYFEREIVMQDGRFSVRSREESSGAEVPLVFVHYSGYSYTKLIQGIIEHPRIDFSEYADIPLINNVYKDAITTHLDTFNRFIRLGYSYATYANGRTVDAFHRRLYHGLRLQGEEVGNPFETGEGSFFSLLRKNGLLATENTDKFTPQNYPEMGKNVKRLNAFYRLLFRMMGYKRYPLFVKSLLAVYCRVENHTFLLKKK